MSFFIVNLEHFTPSSSVFIVNFEKANSSWIAFTVNSSEDLRNFLRTVFFPYLVLSFHPFQVLHL